MSILDTHVHFVAYQPADYPWITAGMSLLRKNHLPADLQPLMAAAGVTGCVAVQARQVPAETDWLIELAKSWPHIKAIVGWVDLRAADLVDQLQGWRNAQLVKGFRHVVIDEPDADFLERADVVAGIAQLGPQGYAFDLLVLPHQLAGATRLARTLPEQRFILDHAGLPDIRGARHQGWSAALAELSAAPNVTMKLSALDFRADWQRWQPADLRPYLETAFELFGASRLMIGSNWPVCNLSSSYAETLNTTLDYISALSPSEQNAVTAGTAEAVYRIT